MSSQTPSRTANRARRSSRPDPPAWVELIPSAALVLAFAIKALLAPNAVRDVFSGAQAFLVAFAIFAGWVLLWLVVLPRLVRSRWIRLLILSTIAGLLIWWLVVSALVDDKVVETLPGSASAASGSTAPRGTDDTEPVSTTTTPAPALLGTARLRGIDHDATGGVALYQRTNGTLIVGLEEIDIEPGPDYKVYVVPGVDRDSPGEHGVFLSDLRGNQGTQYYDVPPDTDLELGKWTVLVWCRAFAVPIAAGTPV